MARHYECAQSVGCSKHFYVNSTNSDVREHTFSIDDFIQGKVDAMSAFRSNQLYELDRLGVSYNVIDPADYGFVSSAVSVLATQNAVVQNPEQTQRFVEATNRGWQYALDNVDEVINMILERYSQQKSAEALRYEAAVSEQMMQLDLFPLGATSDELAIQRAYNNWVSVRNETAFDYTLFWQFFAGVAVAGAFLFINNLRLRRLSHQLLTMSITDSLTGVGNRARADQLLRSAHRDLKKGAPGCGLILCDIDHFKTINDTHGHQVGDVILKEFAATLLSAMRSDAEICRWGGEEFLILIRETDEHGLQVLADRLRTCIAETTFSAGLKVTASFGFGMQNPNISIDRNITNIDDALYQAKNSGRNCPVAADIH